MTSTELVVRGVPIEAEYTYVPGHKGSHDEPPEHACIEDLVVKIEGVFVEHILDDGFLDDVESYLLEIEQER